MSPTLTAIIVFAAIIALMVIQTNISKLQSPLWGCIIPTIVVLGAVFAFLVFKIGITFGSVVTFLIPLIWSIEEFYRGRKRRTVETEKEIVKMKARDIS